MDFPTWLEAHGPGAKSIIHRRTGLRWGTIHSIAEGRTRPRPKTALAIERATDGVVTAEELLLGGLREAEAADLEAAE